jgi:hypothetical protein
MLRRAVAISAFFALVVILWPARGLTFLWDDWLLLARVHEPLRWLEPINEHWTPLYAAFFALEYALFGARHTFFLLTTWTIHVVNLALLGTVIRRKTGDDRAAAVAVLAFGLLLTWREVLWWACLGGLALSFTVVLLGFHAADRAARPSSPGAGLLMLVSAGVAAFVAPLFFGSAIALGPALALELAPGRRALVPLAGFAAYAVLYAGLGHPPEHTAAAGAVGFVVDQVGIGIVRRSLLLPTSLFPDDPRGHPMVGILLAGAYALAMTALAATRTGDRGVVLRAQAWLLLVAVPIALARSNMPPIAAAWSRYQYFLSLAWALPLAVGLAKRPRAQVATALLLVPLAVGHAQESFRDGRPYAPAARRDHAAFVQALAAIAHESSASLENVPVPITLAWKGTRAKDIVRALSPETR